MVSSLHSFVLFLELSFTLLEVFDSLIFICNCLFSVKSSDQCSKLFFISLTTIFHKFCFVPLISFSNNFYLLAILVILVILFMFFNFLFWFFFWARFFIIFIVVVLIQFHYCLCILYIEFCFIAFWLLI